MEIDRQAFEGGVAVITGAGAGIGAGLARRAAALGMIVIAVDVDARRADRTVAAIRTAGGKAHARVVDVSRPDELDRLAAELSAEFGDIRLLINNAGIETLGYTWEIPIERWEATLDVNIHGVIHGVRAFVPHMLASGKQAYIANTASIVAMSAMPTQTAYVLTKHAVQAFSEGLYLEMQARGAPIHVSSILPGMIRTSIFDSDTAQGEPDDAAGHRKTMFDLLDQHGMDPDEAAERFLLQIAQRRFWVFSHPDEAQRALDRRAGFLHGQEEPVLSPQGRQLLGLPA